ncbi:hypothetical protein E2C01_052457 [Portunus trituberculatus]|uniref:Uncharacterized protein n=1 Tax=Portunus trituberculatus TaxID=210409 RepID=A0A5B7GHL8_PORTR|nr:hypothetical protein [Portunus trituberculatus]
MDTPHPQCPLWRGTTLMKLVWVIWSTKMQATTEMPTAAKQITSTTTTNCNAPRCVKDRPRDTHTHTHTHTHTDA